jgi:hypothetical protein
LLAVLGAPIAAGLGDCATAHAMTVRAMTSNWPLDRARAALPLAMCGDARRAMEVIERLEKDDSEDTLVNGVWIPVVRAAVALAENHPDQAIRELDRTGSYDGLTIWPGLLRGQALLRLHKGADARQAFQTLKDNPGRYDWAFPLYPMVDLWLARAARLGGDRAAARMEFDAFFASWSDADPDLRPVIEARREYRACCSRSRTERSTSRDSLTAETGPPVRPTFHRP